MINKKVVFILWHIVVGFDEQEFILPYLDPGKLLVALNWPEEALPCMYFFECSFSLLMKAKVGLMVGGEITL